jgi:hypothetical protein
MGVPILASCGFRNMPPRYWPYSSVMATRWNRQQWSSWPRADCGSVIRADPYRLRRKKVGVPGNWASHSGFPASSCSACHRKITALPRRPGTRCPVTLRLRLEQGSVGM